MSLRRIALRDFVIIRALELDLFDGFTALTGETGAGKSILIDALQLATGGRADGASVREGAARLDVSAEFDAEPHLLEWLREGGFDEGEQLLLRRSVDAEGRSRGWINGRPATATQLRELGGQLLDIHGQHAWQSLMRPDAMRALLDAYASATTAAMESAWQHWREALAALEQARAAQGALHQERERLQWQLAELDKLAPGENEWNELSAEHTRLSHAQALIDAAQAASTALDADDSGALAALSRAASALQSQQHLEPDFSSPAELLQSCQAQLSDALHSLHGYLRRMEVDPQRLAELDERMGSWMSLARRYRRTPDELPALVATWRAELQKLDSQSDMVALESAHDAARASYLKEARMISKLRREAAPQLTRAVTQAIQSLGMAGGVFEVALEPLDAPSRSGLESVSFLVAGHVGSTPRPVGKIASGGELSRIALAIAVTTSALGAANTLIFDEVDAGIGGTVASTVGQLMRQLGLERQVLAVTHLPQVAASAHHHLQVSKETVNGGDPAIESRVQALDEETRVDEIARMLGGELRSAASKAHARELLQNAAQSRRTTQQVLA